MSYGGQSNAPWQRNVMQGHQQSGGFHQGSQMYMQSAQQNNMAAFGHGGMQGGGSGNMFPGGSGGGNSVSYPQPRSGLNPVAFQQGGNSQSHYNSIGTVTKISNDCGLVNDEIFFYRNVCKGPEPILGDRVIFEATYSNNGQFKWNATRIQLMQQPQPLMGSNKSSYNSVAPPNEYQRGPMRRNSPKRSPIRGGHDRERERLHRSRDRDEIEHERKRRREEPDRSRDRAVSSNNRGGAEARAPHPARNDKDRDRVEPRKKERDVADREREDRDRERNASRGLEVHRPGPKDRRVRNRKRYMVKIPKSLLTIKTADLQDLRQRYNALYIPSDFFLSNIKWSDSFTTDNPFSLRRPCHFHIMHEMVESPTAQDPDLLEPADANYLYTAKVMLLSLPPIAEIYKKCFENDDNDDHNVLHPSRLINFLVGVKGGVGTMAIGGPWSPSLDGENPDKDPSVLIRTAIRTCKALTGIDLSNCTQWYRFVEIYYHRTEYKNMEKDGPPRVETVVIYLPDVHSCMPSIEEWQTLTQTYKNAADDAIARRSAAVAAAAAENTNNDNDQSSDVEMADSSTLDDDAAQEDANETPTNNLKTSAENKNGDVQSKEEQDDGEEMEDSADISGAADEDCEVVEIEDDEHADEETTANDENEEPAPEPTHYSLLDLKNMKVPEIRDELLARNLSDKGVRNVIMARLAKALNTEKAEETKNKPRNKNFKANETSNKDKKAAEKVNAGSEIPSKTAGKKTANETKNNKEEDNVNGKGKSTKSPVAKKSDAKDKSEQEDKTDWADIIFELSDIVVLDEYDSSKNVEETNLKEMTEKEKARLIRCHTLPSSPHIVVHPNRQAKDGKFDCAVKSLSVLLDYHPDDNKERFFEVSLFAEVFNDMLMRDFGFNIYKEIYLHKETASTNNVCDITEIKTEGDTKNEKSEMGDEIKSDSKEKNEDKEKSSKKDKSAKDQHTEDTQSNKSESRKRKLSTSTSTANGKDREVSVSDKKMVVVKPQLLLSFVYFDTTHCGYIFEKDLEDLFAVLGLNLSRSQIKKVLGMCKLSKYEAVHYRELTDKEETLEYIPTIEDGDDIPIHEFKRIAAGNNQYESIFGGSSTHNQISSIGNDESNEGLINFNGTVVHVGKLLNQINRTEKNYSDLEKVYNDLLKQHSDLQKDHNKSNTKIKDLQAEIKTTSRKLIEANQDFYSLNRKYRDQNATLSYIYTRVAPYFVREKDKDKDAKSDGNREKDKENKEKDNEKSKDKDSEKEKEKTKDEKDKEVKKERTKDEKEVKDDKEKIKEDKEKVKDDKEKVKDEKEKLKTDKVKDEKENEKEKEKLKDDKEKEQEKVKVKDEKEKEKEKVKEQPKIEKEKPKDEKQKEKSKEDKEKPPAKDDKVKPPTKDDKVKPTPQKNVVEKQKPSTPAAKKLNDSKPAGKVIKKSDGAKK